jgi:hypothetical protein
LHFELQRESVVTYLIHWIRELSGTSSVIRRGKVRQAA